MALRRIGMIHYGGVCKNRRLALSDTNLPTADDALTDSVSQVSNDGASPNVKTAAERAAKDADGQADAVLGFRSQDRRVIRVLLILLLLSLTVEWIVVATRRPDPLLLKRGLEFQTQFQVHVNDATWVDWVQLEGIGPSLAHRIVADRRLHGPFSTIEDVGRVPGIGPETVERIRPWLTMGHDENKHKSDAGQRPPE